MRIEKTNTTVTFGGIKNSTGTIIYADACYAEGIFAMIVNGTAIALGEDIDLNLIDTAEVTICELVAE